MASAIENFASMPFYHGVLWFGHGNEDNNGGAFAMLFVPENYIPPTTETAWPGEIYMSRDSDGGLAWTRRESEAQYWGDVRRDDDDNNPLIVEMVALFALLEC
jgi:hypothetical protein